MTEKLGRYRLEYLLKQVVFEAITAGLHVYCR